MTRYRFTNAQGGDWLISPHPDRNRTRHTGARFEPTPDIRKGSIRGFVAMCLVFGLLCVVGVMLP